MYSDQPLPSGTKSSSHYMFRPYKTRQANIPHGFDGGTPFKVELVVGGCGGLEMCVFFPDIGVVNVWFIFHERGDAGIVLLRKKSDSAWVQLGEFNAASSYTHKRFFIFDLTHENITVKKPFGEFDAHHDNYFRTDSENDPTDVQSIIYALSKMQKDEGLIEKCLIL